MGTIKKIAGLLLRVEESYHDYKKRSLLSLSGLIWRSVVVGLIYVVTSMIIASLGSSIGVASDTPTGVDPTIILLSMFVGGIMISLVMGPISTKLTLSHAQRIGVLFLVLYMFTYLIGAPEVLLFTTYSLQFQSFMERKREGCGLGLVVIELQDAPEVVYYAMY